MDELPVTAKDIALETSKDSVLMKVYDYIIEGWPNKPVDENIQPFYQRKDQLSTDQGCLLWGRRVIMPTTLQARMLNELHATHAGVVKMKAVARSAMWWLKMDQEIEDVVSTCDSCSTKKLTTTSTPAQLAMG